MSPFPAATRSDKNASQTFCLTTGSASLPRSRRIVVVVVVVCSYTFQSPEGEISSVCGLRFLIGVPFLMKSAPRLISILAPVGVSPPLGPSFVLNASMTVCVATPRVYGKACADCRLNPATATTGRCTSPLVHADRPTHERHLPHGYFYRERVRDLERNVSLIAVPRCSESPTLSNPQVRVFMRYEFVLVV